MMENKKILTILSIIDKRVSEIENDSRYQAGLKKPATIDINAPLALIQTSFETEIRTLKRIRKLLL